VQSKPEILDAKDINKLHDSSHAPDEQHIEVLKAENSI